MRQVRPAICLINKPFLFLYSLNFHLVADISTFTGSDNIGKEATLLCRSTVDFYANPAIMYFFVTLTAFSSTCKPVNSGEWVKKLLKHKNGVRCLDIDLDFDGGKYFASLRLSRGYKGMLEVVFKCDIFYIFLYVYISLEFLFCYVWFYML